jgi:hypothetical protein
MLKRKYMLVRSTHKYHLYEWIDAPEGTKNFEKQAYLPKADLGDDPPAELVSSWDVE